MKNLSLLTSIILLLSITGCSILPYEEEFACQKDRSYGKCTSVEGAYNEAVTGVESGAVIKKDGAVKETRKEKKKKEKELASINEKSEASTYQNYRAEMYDQLEALTAQPKTPMVKRAVEVRTLILSYSPTDKKDRLYMPRFIYSIHQPAEFVLGQYLLENEDDIDAMSDLMKPSK